MNIILNTLDVIVKNVTESLPDICSLRSSRVVKADNSYVTKGDLLVQEITKNIFTEQIPSVLIVSEESRIPSESGKTGITIVLDPIDGTENFTSGLSEWGISVSCYENGIHAGSLIGCPEMNMWIKTGDKIERHQSRIQGLSSSLNKEDILRATEGFEYRIMGCCVYNMMNVIRGSFHSFENPKGAWSWDILAGLNLALEHGLTVTVEGKPYEGQYLQPTQKYRFKISG
jgi:fructose-1,6-bisphosphatase/inositol monophosphatase family enzyme